MEIACECRWHVELGEVDREALRTGCVCGCVCVYVGVGMCVLVCVGVGVCVCICSCMWACVRAGVSVYDPA